MEIYVDYVLAENLSFNYLILYMASKILKKQIKSTRLFSGSIIGAIYSLIQLVFQDLAFLNGAIAKILLSLIIVTVVFWPKNMVELFKNTIIFYLSTFLFAGTIFGLSFLGLSEVNIFSGNFVSFSKPKIFTYILSILTVFIILLVVKDYLINKIRREQNIIKFEIWSNGKFKEFTGLIDTGSFLVEPITRDPVVIVEFSEIAEILSQKVKDLILCFSGKDLDTVYENIGGEYSERLRILPFNVIGNDHGVLIGIKPDFIRIIEPFREVKKVVIGISKNKLSQNSEFNAILNPEIIN